MCIKIYARLKNPFCNNSNPKINKTKEGIGTKIINNIKIPLKKSIQLAKSLSIPREDFTRRIIPKKSKIEWAISKFEAKRKKMPTRRSIAPKTFINIFFKPGFSLKIYAQVAQPG